MEEMKIHGNMRTKKESIQILRTLGRERLHNLSGIFCKRKPKELDQNKLFVLCILAMLVPTVLMVVVWG